MKKMWQVIKGIFDGNSGADNRKKTMQNLIVLGGLGVVLMILSNYFNADKNAAKVLPVTAVATQAVEKDSNQEQIMEQRLQTMLQQLPGVGRVDVMIVFDATKQLVIQQNVENNQQVTEEQDRNGATRQIHEQSKQSQTVMQQSAGNQQPLVVQTIQPKVRGVLIIAEGAENLSVKQMILDAVRKGLDVRLSAISILPSDSKAEY
jgi:stage III sporulation protein AG